MNRILLILLIILIKEEKPYSQYLLYGTTGAGGIYNNGTIFKYNPFIGEDSVVFNFNGTTQGSAPCCNLLLANNGFLYGTTNLGGSYGEGVLFSFNFHTNTENVLLNFDSAIGTPSNGITDLIQGKNGLLYGTTYGGGSDDAGVIFSYNTGTGKDSVLFNFDSIRTGSGPCRALYQDTATEILYGITEYGGLGMGVLYDFNPVTNKDSVLIKFDTGYGPYAPLSGLIKASDGLLYSMAPGGGKFKRYGVIYTYNTSTGILDTVFSFNYSDGASPWGNELIQLSNGMMYGMTYEGGSTYNGTVFSFNPNTYSEQVIQNLTYADGTDPHGSLIQDPDNGLLYGMTPISGNYNYGTFFSYDISTSSFTKILDFNGADGANPESGLTLVKDSSLLTGVQQEKGESEGVRVYPNPNNGVFTIALGNAELFSASQATIEIYDIFGQCVYNATLKHIQSDNLINLSGQPEGIYFYRVFNEKEIPIGQGKIIIEK